MPRPPAINCCNRRCRRGREGEGRGGGKGVGGGKRGVQGFPLILVDCNIMSSRRDAVRGRSPRRRGGGKKEKRKSEPRPHSSLALNLLEKSVRAFVKETHGPLTSSGRHLSPKCVAGDRHREIGGGKKEKKELCLVRRRSSSL